MKSPHPEGATHDTGPIGPVAISALLVLIAASPIMRGGNRQVALIALEALALIFLLALLAGTRHARVGASVSRGLLVFLLASPAWLAAIYLVPIDAGWWRASAGREMYADVLARAGMATGDRLPLSLLPDATAASLFAGIPLVAAFLAGHVMRMRQLRLALTVLVVVAFLQVVVGVLQVAGGQDSSLYFGGVAGRPFGTFANPNHFANYVAMALAVYAWLAGTDLASRRHHRDEGLHSRLEGTQAVALWWAGGVLLLIGILMSRSRGAALAGLPAALWAATIVIACTSRLRSWRTILVVVAIGTVAAMALVGLDFVVSRFNLRGLSTDASFRALLASSTLQGAAQFWPWGAGWGTYAGVYPRFQPASVTGLAEHAHHDYAELLFEGGIFAVLLMAAFACLAAMRAALLVRASLRNRRLSREELASAVCGIGLAGFLLHSFVEFNMHIPANAIAAALLAGAYLRPLGVHEENGHD